MPAWSRVLVLLALLPATGCERNPSPPKPQPTDGQEAAPTGRRAPAWAGQLAAGDPRVRRAHGATYLFAGPPGSAPDAPEAEWFDFNGAPFPPEELQQGAAAGGPRALDDPAFVPPDAPRLLEDGPDAGDIAVLGWQHEGSAHAYPLAALALHPVINDELAGRPVVVCWHPAAQQAAVFAREPDDRFRPSGYARRDLLLLVDQASSSLWYPRGPDAWRAISGPRRGAQLSTLATLEPTTLEQWRAAHPDTRVLVPPARP